jgi:hypothetical protein
MHFNTRPLSQSGAATASFGAAAFYHGASIETATDFPHPRQIGCGVVDFRYLERRPAAMKKPDADCSGQRVSPDDRLPDFTVDYLGAAGGATAGGALGCTAAATRKSNVVSAAILPPASGVWLTTVSSAEPLAGTGET